MAKYTDAGGQGTGTLTSQSTRVLRPSRWHALFYDTLGGFWFEKINGVKHLATEAPTGFATYRNVDLTGIAAIKLNLRLTSAPAQGFTVELHQNAPTGPLLATTDVKDQVPIGAYAPVTLPIKPAGKGALCVVIKKKAKEPSTLLLDWIEVLRSSGV